MGLLDNLKGAAGDFLSEAKDNLVEDAKDRALEATGLDKVAEAAEDVTAAKDSVGDAIASLRDGLSRD